MNVMATEHNHVRIAVLEAELRGLREQHRAHAESTQQAIRALSEDVKALVAVMNRGKGAFGFAMLIAGTLGAAAVALVDYILRGGAS
jgi:hypothetical protein